ncbi:MAG: xanthine dehydrogenase family protein molybdopterin-binding subunit [Chloroflexi bacterium]|nr:xanthine dehydrogenase family protein molybdopterin-binding subunit [Chloroflexota bacterium]
MPYNAIGKSLARVDAADKVSGAAKYAGDVKLPYMLYGKILGSPYPHARIRRIDTLKAERLAGVKAVITAADFPDVRIGPLLMDQPVIAREKVRFVGEFVAAVAAVDEETAQEAIELIEVEYEELPAVFDPLEAMSPDAPLIHQDVGNYNCTFPAIRHGNVCTHVKIHHGDVEEGFRGSHLILEETFTTPVVHQGYIEPHAAVATVDPSGKITVWASVKGVFRARQEIAQALRMPMTKIRVICPYLGGDFGGKGLSILEPLCALLSMKSRRPVKIRMGRDEELTATRPRHPARIQIKIGASQEGMLTALKGTVIFDAGAYADTGPRVIGKCASLQGVYHIPHVYIDGYCVYTNKTPFGNCRGPGTPQVNFAIESMIDMIAERIGMDSHLLREKNAVEDGAISPTGQVLHGVALKETMKAAVQQVGRGDPPEGNNRGMGMACGNWESGTGPSSADIKINEDGTVVLSTGAVEQGAGPHTILCQIVAEELGLSLKDVSLVAADTDATPYEGPTGASRTTFTAGLTVKMAATDARRQILEMAAERLEANTDDLEMSQGQVRVKGSPDKNLPIRSLTMAKGPVMAKASLNRKGLPYDPSYTEGHAGPSQYGHTYFTYVTQVEVDPEMGNVRLMGITAAQDVGLAINPQAVEGQIEGGLSNGIGYALSEAIIFDHGRVTTDSFQDYRMPTALDMPPIHTMIIEKGDENGPYGAKGAGESPVVPVAPAIANAVHRAVGVRLKDLPLTPEKVFWALKGKTPPPGIGQ